MAFPFIWMSASVISTSFYIIDRIEKRVNTAWYGILGFNVPIDTVYVISETGGPEQ